MSTPCWHLLAYDISQPRRARRLQRAVRAQAHFLLESLYLCHAGSAEQAKQLGIWRQLAGADSAPHVVSYRLLPGRALRVFGTAAPVPGLLQLGLPAMVRHEVDSLLPGELLLPP